MRPTGTLVTDIYGQGRIHDQPTTSEDFGRPTAAHTPMEADHDVRGQLDKEGVSPTIEPTGVRPATRLSTWERSRDPTTSGWYHGGLLARGLGNAGNASIAGNHAADQDVLELKWHRFLTSSTAR